MKTVLDILRKGGGWRPSLYLKIENPPYMELVIEATDESGPCGLWSISVAHSPRPVPIGGRAYCAMAAGVAPSNRQRSINFVVELPPRRRVETAGAGCPRRKIRTRSAPNFSVSICTALRAVTSEIRIPILVERVSGNILASIRRKNSLRHRDFPACMFAPPRALPKLLMRLGDAARGFTDHFASYRTSAGAKRKARESRTIARHLAG